MGRTALKVMPDRKFSFQPSIEAGVVFAVLYLCLHCIHFGLPGATEFILVIGCFMAGAVLGIASVLIQLRRKKKHNFWQHFFTFVILWAVVLIVSAILFYTSPETGLLYAIFYIFPQMILVAFMIPGALIYYLIEFLYHRSK